MPDDALVRSAPLPFRRDPPARIGVFEVRAASNELAGPGGVVRLRPRLMDVLLRLAAAPGEVVPRQVLLDDVWPRRLVADEVLSRTIAELRIALADDARDARYVETLPKVGYRLIAAVERRAAAAAPPPARQSGTDAETDASDASPSAHVAPGAALEPHEPAGGPYTVVAGTVDPGTSAVRTRRRTAAIFLSFVALGAAAWMLARNGASDRPSAPARALERQLTNAGQFSSDLAMELSPRFSKDGTRVAFALGDYEHAHIVMQDVATRTRTEFGGADAFQFAPVFFPDGLRLAYFRRQGKACAIVERTLATGAERTLVDCTDEPFGRFDIAPDGAHLVYGALREGDTGLRVLDLRAGGVTRLTSPPAGAGVDSFPRFSPDGRQVAFMRGTQGGGREVWLVDGGNPASAHVVGAARGLAWGLAWMGPQGPLLVAADWFGFRALNVLDPVSGKAELAGARGAQFPDVAPNGDVVYESAAYEANLRLVDLANPAAPAAKLWPSSRYTNYPQFAPDGHRVLFLSNRDNAASLFVGELDGAARRLPLPSDVVFTRAHWSHDGRAIYAIRSSMTWDTSSQHAVRIDPESGGVDTLDALGEGVSDVRENVDGTFLYFTTQVGGLMQLWRAAAADPGRHEMLALPPVEEYDLRGNRLAYADPKVTDLTVCDLPALTCAPAGLPALGSRSGWALGDGALWVGVYGDPGELVRFDLARREITARAPHGPFSIGPNLDVAPGERYAIVSRQEPPAIDLMLARRPR